MSLYCLLFLSESDLVIFLADSKPPYFKPKVQAKNILGKYAYVFVISLH